MIGGCGAGSDGVGTGVGISGLNLSRDFMQSFQYT